MPMLEENQRPDLEEAAQSGSKEKQRRQMLIALALLLAALMLVLAKDWQFWFPSSTAAELDAVDEDEAGAGAPSAVKSTTTQLPVASRAKAKQPPAASAADTAAAQAALAPVVTNRAVLPPLEVEVVAGDQRRIVQPGNPSIKVELQPKSTASASGTMPPQNNPIA
jgi:cytoskeletal protein RodZ